MAIAQIVTRGFGTFGSIEQVTVRGYAAREAAPTPDPEVVEGAASGEYPGGSGGWVSQRDRQRQREAELHNQELLDIIQLAVPEIIKRLR